MNQAFNKSAWAAVLLSSALLLGAMSMGCQSKGAASKVQTDDSEAMAAKRDSLMQVYKRKLMITWSLGFENYKNKQYQDATKHFWRIVEMDTINLFPDVYGLLQDAYFKLGKADSAEMVVRMGVEKRPQDVGLRRVLAYIEAAKGNIDEAIKGYEFVVEHEPESLDDWRRLADLYVRSDRLEEAIQAYEKIVELDPEDQKAQEAIAALYRATGQAERAVEQKEKILATDPTNTKLMFELGETYFRMGEYNKAIEKFQMLLQRIPDDAEALEYLGNSYQNIENYQSAINTYQKLLKLEISDNKRKKILAELARCYKELGQWTVARRYARRSLNMDPKFGLALIAMGEIYEAAAEKCVSEREDGKPSFDDKLVYEMAANYYRRARQDLAFREEAERRLSYVEVLVPTQEDRFFHKGKTKPTDPCYSWIGS